MIKKYERQDQYGNQIYNYSSSDIILDLDTGHTVKQDIDTIMSALGISGQKPSSDVKLNAVTLEGHAAADFVLDTTYQKAIETLNTNISNKADVDSPVFTGTPTVPNVNAKDGTQKIANTLYVDNAATALKEEITNALKEYAKSVHQHSAGDITAGTFADTAVKARDGSDYNVARVRNIQFLGASEQIPSTLPNGTLLAVYEG